MKDRLALAVLLLGILTPFSAALATDYYVDPETGSDEADGLTPTSAWQTLDRVSNATELQGGDVVKFRRGRVWRESLAPRSGEEGAPIV